MTTVRPDDTAGNARTIVYVANAESRDISVLELDERNGQLTLLETVPVGGRVAPMALSPDRHVLYAGLRSEPYSVCRFAIDPDSSRLRPLQTAPLADNMCYLSTDRTGRYLFAASYSGSRISINAIGADGAVAPEPLAVIQTGQNAHAVAVDPSNRFLFVTNLGDDQIMQYQFAGEAGEVTPNEPPLVKTQPGAGPRHFVFHPDGPWVFCLNELDGSVDSYRLEERGTLTPLASVSALPDGFSGKPWAADLHLTPDGRFLFASERTSSTLAAFAVSREGGLSLLGHAATATQPRAFAITPSGRYLIAAGEQSHELWAHAIDGEHGGLRELSRLAAGNSPNWVEIISVPAAS